MDEHLNKLPEESEFTQRLIDFISEVEDDIPYLKYLELKVALHKEEQQAVAIYTHDLANRPDLTARLTAFDFYRLGSLCLQGIESLAPENRIIKRDQASEFFLQGQLKGDKDCKTILIHLLSTQETLKLGLPAPNYGVLPASGQGDNEEANEQLISRFVKRMEASQGEAREALLTSQRELIALVHLLGSDAHFWKSKVRLANSADRQVPQGIARFQEIIREHHNDPVSCLEGIHRCAAERYSEKFQWLHYFFRGRDKQTNEIYHILKELNPLLKELNPHTQESVDETIAALKQYTAEKPLKNLSGTGG